jgi:hypothetical protein
MNYNRLKHYAKKVKEESEDLDRRLFAKVSGVTFEGRQSVLEKMTRETPVKLERDRRNAFDSYAIKVMAEIDSQWVEAGFVPRPMNKKVSQSLDNGADLPIHVHRVTGGMYSEYNDEILNFGLEICINPER